MYKLAARSNCSFKTVQIARWLPDSIVPFSPLKCMGNPGEKMYLFSVVNTVHAKVANSNPTNYIFLRSAINTLSSEHIKSQFFQNLKIRLECLTRLTQLGMLPLMYIYEISDILFFFKSLKTPTDKFNILNHVSFNTGSTRSSGIKLHHKTAHTNAAMNSYFFRLPRLWDSLPIIDHTQSLIVIKQKLKKFLWNHFLANFDNSLCCFHYLCPCSCCSKNPPSNNFNHL